MLTYFKATRFLNCFPDSKMDYMTYVGASKLMIS